MKKFNHKIKRAVAMFLTFAMVVGLIPYVPTRAHEVQAATTSSTGGTPSVSAYATKEQMMDGTFATNTEGKADNYGKILFGKAELFNNTSDTHPIEWLILGKDEGVAGDNTIILATRMINFVQYNTTQNMYINIAGDITENDARYPLKNTYVYPGCTLPNEIDCSHYGLSLLRAQAILAANDSNLFSVAQQELMNATTVTTTDTRNKDSAGKNLTYTTTDKLYAPATDKIGCTYIKVGSNNQVVIDIESFKKYYDSTFQYWTRTAYDGNSVYIFPEVSLTKTHVTLCSDIKNFLPVSNLNLSNLLFASSAKAATSNTESGAVSGTIAADTALTLRLDGKDKKIGAAYCDAEDGVIVADKAAAATGTVSLVVQGNDGTNDWYYSVPVEGRTVVKADEIKSKCSLSTAPNLADCHIWLEITDTDGMVYANSAKAKDISLIDNVAVTGVKPVGGMAFTTASCTTTGIAITTAKITYTTKENENDVAVTDKLAAWDKTYKATFSLATGIENDVVYAFTDHVSVNIDGEGTDNTISPNADGTLTVTKEFTTLKRKIVSVTAPAVPADNTFTTYYGFDGNADSP